MCRTAIYFAFISKITRCFTASSGSVPKMSSFDELRRQCTRTRQLFEDSDFPAVDSSMFYSKTLPIQVVWKRPREIVNDPKMIVEGATYFDVVQGMLDDSWVLAAMSSLCRQEKLFKRVVPEDQYYSGNNYAGIFRFNLWQYGEWKEVIVDDRLPTYNNRLVFAHSAQTDEFWAPLLEKAYAISSAVSNSVRSAADIDRPHKFKKSSGLEMTPSFQRLFTMVNLHN